MRFLLIIIGLFSGTFEFKAENCSGQIENKCEPIFNASKILNDLLRNYNPMIRPSYFILLILKLI